MKYDKEPLPGCETVYMFGGQEGLQKFMVVIALLCVPVLLLGKPFYVRMQMKKNSHAVWQVDDYRSHFKRIQYFYLLVLLIVDQALHNPNNQNGAVEGEDIEVAGEPAQEEGEEHDFADIMIHQVLIIYSIAYLNVILT